MVRYDDDYGYYDTDDYEIAFANPGSALRAETENNPRCCECPTCGEQNVLTLEDVQLGYQCDECANLAEQGF